MVVFSSALSQYNFDKHPLALPSLKQEGLDARTQREGFNKVMSCISAARNCSPAFRLSWTVVRLQHWLHIALVTCRILVSASRRTTSFIISHSLHIHATLGDVLNITPAYRDHTFRLHSQVFSVRRKSNLSFFVGDSFSTRVTSSRSIFMKSHAHYAKSAGNKICSHEHPTRCTCCRNV